MKEKSEKFGLKLSIQKTKIMASGPITSWKIDREIMKTVRDFNFRGLQKSLQMLTEAMKLKDTAWKKSYDHLDSILKDRDITLLAKVHLVTAMVFPVVMYGCKSLTTKKAEHQRTDAFELLEKTLENPSDCKEIKPVHPKGDQS